MATNKKWMKLGLGIPLYSCFLILIESPGDKTLYKKPVFPTTCLIQEAKEVNLFRDLRNTI